MRHKTEGSAGLPINLLTHCAPRSRRLVCASSDNTARDPTRPWPAFKLAAGRAANTTPSSLQSTTWSMVSYSIWQRRNSHRASKVCRRALIKKHGGVLSQTVTPAVFRKKPHDAQVVAKDAHAAF